MSSKWKISKGRILLYRVYDIGEEVDLEKSEKILAEAPTSRSKFRLEKMDRQAVIVSNDPLNVVLGTHSFCHEQKSFMCEVSAKAWEFGTLSLTFEFAIPEGTSVCELKGLAATIQDYDDLDGFARAKARELAQQIKAAIGKIKPVEESDINEDYILFFIEKFSDGSGRDPVSGSENVADILAQEDIASLILNEKDQSLAPQVYERLYESKLQYFKNDLAVIDWNSAFVVEPSGSMDIPDVIEFALNQLLEMRYYDDLLDKQLKEIYSAIELKRTNIFSPKYTNLALAAGQRYIEIAEIVEAVENSLKVIGDLYHSIVFRTASSKFRFKDWQTSIDNKLENLAKVCTLLLDHVNNSRSHLLELIVIALISLELIPLVEYLQKLLH